MICIAAPMRAIHLQASRQRLHATACALVQQAPSVLIPVLSAVVVILALLPAPYHHGLHQADRAHEHQRQRHVPLGRPASLPGREDGTGVGGVGNCGGDGKVRAWAGGTTSCTVIPAAAAVPSDGESSGTGHATDSRSRGSSAEHGFGLALTQLRSILGRARQLLQAGAAQPAVNAPSAAASPVPGAAVQQGGQHAAPAEHERGKAAHAPALPDHQGVLPELARRQGVVRFGASVRLRRAVWELLQGRHINVSWQGGGGGSGEGVRRGEEWTLHLRGRGCAVSGLSASTNQHSKLIGADGGA